MPEAVWAIIVGIVLLALFVLVNAAYGVSIPLTTNTLQQAGYTNIEIGTYSWFGCADDDWYATKFKASLNSRDVKGVVCCGLFFKNCTIRFS